MRENVFVVCAQLLSETLSCKIILKLVQNNFAVSVLKTNSVICACCLGGFSLGWCITLYYTVKLKERWAFLNVYILVT